MNVLAHFGQNFDFKIRMDYGKHSYERRAYESVDDRSLYILGYISKIDRKNNSGHKGLNIRKSPQKLSQNLLDILRKIWKKCILHNIWWS